jgi:hypothetical protein
MIRRCELVREHLAANFPKRKERDRSTIEHIPAPVWMTFPTHCLRVSLFVFVQTWQVDPSAMIAAANSVSELRLFASLQPWPGAVRNPSLQTLGRTDPGTKEAIHFKPPRMETRSGQVAQDPDYVKEGDNVGTQMRCYRLASARTKAEDTNDLIGSCQLSTLNWPGAGEFRPPFPCHWIAYS